MNGTLAISFESFGEQLARELPWFSPELALVGTIIAILIAPLAIGRSSRSTATIALVGIVVTMICTLRVAETVKTAGVSGLAPAEAGGLLIVDNLTTYYKLILMVFAAGVSVLWWYGAADREKDPPAFFTLLLGSALGMSLMVSSLNLLVLIIAIEFASLPSYAIVAFDKRDRLGAEGALKYVIFGAISFAVLCYGASLLYGLYQTLDLGIIAGAVLQDLSAGENQVAVALALLALFFGIGFKISAVPFHFWCPDAFQGARIEVTTWLSVVSKAAGLLLLLRLVHVFGVAAGPVQFEAPPTEALAWVIGIIAMITCTVGNLSAYVQTSVKRLLAYSSIAHAGYMLMACSIFAYTGADSPNVALSAVMLYILVYLFMNLGAFGVTAMVVWATGSDSIDAFTGLIRRSVWLAIPMLFCLISLVGLPPFGGFVAKLWLLLALANPEAGGGTPLHWILIIVAVLNTLISLFFYLRIVKQMMLRDDERPAVQAPVGGLALVNVCGVVVLLLGFLIIQPVTDFADRYAANLFTPSVTQQVRVAEPEAVDAVSTLDFSDPLRGGRMEPES
ncbi:MAG: NADH-quinone oxidoreductase subunit N [Phycisphaerae bacterium]|nr:NADH-quinone oxidoreductase subunit N [Phycisphaerae bacterium]